MVVSAARTWSAVSSVSRLPPISSRTGRVTSPYVDTVFALRPSRPCSKQAVIASRNVYPAWGRTPFAMSARTAPSFNDMTPQLMKQLLNLAARNGQLAGGLIKTYLQGRPIP